jgi:hypothetical protein
MNPANPDLKLIHHNLGRYAVEDDPSYPFRLDVKITNAGVFMEFAVMMIYGNYETLCVRGRTREALEQFVEKNQLRTHPRLISLEIIEPEKAAVVAS